MLAIHATIHVSTEPVAPRVRHHSTETGCFHLMLSGEDVFHPYASAYGTPDELRRWLESAIAAVDQYEADHAPIAKTITAAAVTHPA